MDAVKWHYYQFRKNFNYPIYVRFCVDDSNSKITHLLNEIGFSAISEAESKKIQLNRVSTRMLTIQFASARLQQQITGSDLLDSYGPESLTLQMGMPIYTYRKVAMMGMPYSRPLWELAIHPEISLTEQMVGLRVVIVRFLSQALAEEGVISYWGTVKDGTVIVMKQAQSFGEAVFIDLKKRVVFSNGGELKLGSSLKILRKDKDTKTSINMSREEVISFLSVSTCLLNFNGITHAMKKAIYELSSFTSCSYGINESQPNL